MVILRINKLNFDLIASGTKKSEWRQLSKYNKKLLLKDRGDGKLDGNKEITQIKFINGYSAEAPELIKEIEFIYYKHDHGIQTNCLSSTIVKSRK